MPRQYTPRVACICQHCGTSFLCEQYRVRKGGGKYCSMSCKGRYRTGDRAANWRGGQIERTCQICGKPFLCTEKRIQRTGGKYCSTSCRGRAKTGPDAPSWKGGTNKPDPSGYVRGYLGTNQRDWMHRIVWAQANGPIPAGHVIHHIDGNRANNDLANLMLMETGAHARLHMTGKRQTDGWSLRHECCRECGTVVRRHVGHGLCTYCYYAARYAASKG